MIVNSYDKIAGVYDSLFLDNDSIVENSLIGKLLSGFDGSVYDIGCGTGLLTDIIDISPEYYFGIDPCEKMINVFLSKKPSYRNSVSVTDFENDYQRAVKYDNIVSLFGSVSYVNSNTLRSFRSGLSRLFLMFYDSQYTPVTYEKTDVYIPHNTYSQTDLRCMFPDSHVFKFNNYQIVYKP